MSTGKTSKIVAYGHTGFRQRDGQWFYLHGGGAVGASGLTVALEGSAARFILPDCAGDVRAAVLESIAFLDIATMRISFPIHAGVHRAPLNEVLRCDAALDLVGTTGTMKSAVMGVAQSHYGSFDYNSLPLNFESTANSLEAELFRLKDTFVVIDEYVPTGGLHDELQKKADRIFRAIANGSSRGRLNADLRSRPERPCRALVAITGEDIPRGESIQARLVIIRCGRGDVDAKKLAVRQGRSGLLPYAMRAYVEWILSRLEQLRIEVPKKYAEVRDGFYGAGHPRAASAMAHFLLGAYYFAEFAKDIGVMTPHDAAVHVELTRAALLMNAKEQVHATEQSNPGARFMDVLRSLYARRTIALQPVGKALHPHNEAGAVEVGWKDGNLAKFEVNVILATVNQELVAMGERQPLQPYGLWKRLAAERCIVPVGDDVTPKFQGEKNGTRVRVIQVPLHLLEPSPSPGSPPPSGPMSSPDPRWGVSALVVPTGTGAQNVAREAATDEEDLDWGDEPEPDADPGDCSDDVAPVRMTLGRPAALLRAADPPTRPEAAAHLGSSAVTENHQPNQLLGGALASSAQEPKRSEERPLEESEEKTGGEHDLPSQISDPPPPRDPWADGQLSHTDLDASILRVGAIGLAVAELGASPQIAIALPGGGVHLIVLGAIGTLKHALERVMVVGHDLKRLVALLHQHGVNPTRLFDTLIAARLLDGHRHDDERFFSLESARTVLGVAPVPAGAGPRAHLSAEAEHVLLFEHGLRADLARHGLEHVAALEFALLPVIADMEAAGIAVDGSAWDLLTSARAGEAAKVAAKLKTALGVRNVDDDFQILGALQRLGLPITQTSGVALAKYSDRLVVEHLRRYRRLIGFVRSSGRAVLKAVAASPDGRVRTNIHQLGAKTGRMSCSDPNLMGLPRDGEVRSCFSAPRGMRLIVGDYKAIEMRVIADQTGDAALRDVFLRGGCPHRHTASIVMNVPESAVNDEQKSLAKPLNFGLCFGMSSETLVPYARKNFGVVMTEAEAAEFKNKFFDHYNGVRAWHERTRTLPAAQLRTRSGRVTHYLRSDEGFNARLSFPIQGTAADGMKAALVLLHPKLPRFGARIVLVVHDEVIVEAPEEHAEEVRALVCDAMIAGMQPYVPSVPIIAEPEIRRTWAA